MYGTILERAIAALGESVRWIEMYGDTDAPGYTHLCLKISELINEARLEKYREARRPTLEDASEPINRHLVAAIHSTMN